MKRKALLLGFAASLLGSMIHAQAPRHDVIVEIATGNWCYYCPGAAMGADDLAADGADVGIVEHHNGDVYTHAASDGRNNYYNVSGFPTALFDGSGAIVGGTHTVSMFPSYKQSYEAAKVVSTPFDLTASWVQNGSDIDVTVSVTQVGSYSGSNLRIQAALTESNIPGNWQGMTENDFVNRSMYPDHNGIAITTSQGGPAVTQNFTMPIGPTWIQQNMELVVWVEDATTQEIFNGKMMPLSTAANAVDITLVGVENELPRASCMTSITPVVKIHNMGNDPLTVATFTYDINGGTPATFNWTGNLAYYDFESVTLPSISLTPQPVNQLNVHLNVANDASANDNDAVASWNGASTHPSGTFMVRIKPDLYGSEITWDLRNSGGTIVASGGPYFDGNRVQINIPVTCAINECYSFGIYDEYGDGIASTSPFGWYLLEAPNGDTIFYGGSYTFSDYVDWKTDNTVSNLPGLQGTFTVSPNPSAGRFELRFIEPLLQKAEYSVWTLDGREVTKATTSSQWNTIDLSDQPAGIYLLRLNTDLGSAVQKLQKF